MKRILKLLARLYPAAWRMRYGAEYEALIEDAEPRARDGFDVLWGAMKMRITARSFVRIVLPCALLGVAVGMGISFLRPAMYRSRTLVTVESSQPQTVNDMVGSLAREAWPSPWLKAMIQRENLYPGERTRMSMDGVVNLMRKNINIRRLQTNGGDAASAFVVQFDYADPRLAQWVEGELASRFIEMNLRMRVQAQETTDFLASQLAAASDPTTKAEIQSKLRQSEAVSDVRETFRVLRNASLPKPVGLGRTEFGMAGMLAGFVVGLLAAAIFGARWSERRISGSE
jgi:hypothetical protein